MISPPPAKPGQRISWNTWKTVKSLAGSRAWPTPSAHVKHNMAALSQTLTQSGHPGRRCASAVDGKDSGP